MTSAVAQSQTPRVRQSLRRALPWLVLLLIALGLVGLTLLQTGGASGGGPALGASNPAPNGAQALARVLYDHGVDVVEAPTLADAKSSGGPDTTVLVYDPSSFLDSEQLRSLNGVFATIVLVRPDFDALNALAPGVHDAGAAGAPVDTDARCDLPAATRAGRIAAPGHAYSVGISSGSGSGSGSGASIGCFPHRDNAFTIVSTRLDAGTGSNVVVVGSTDVFDNQHITEAGNAALAANLLGSHGTLVWYLPTLTDASPGGPVQLSALTPGWVTPLVILGAAVFLAAAIWRGRRFGPLVPESLPVVVRADETVAGRARLYQRSSARLRALDSLRIGVLGRITTLTGQPRSARVDDIAARVAALLDIDPEGVLRILRDEEPETDVRLLQLSDQLTDLEARVRASVGRPGRMDR